MPKNGVANVGQRVGEQAASGKPEVVLAIGLANQQQAERQDGRDQRNGGEQRGCMGDHHDSPCGRWPSSLRPVRKSKRPTAGEP
ncbi:hypothetical protein D3C81_1163580 [compost metagenome]